MEDLVLQILPEIDEVVAVAGHPHDQVSVVLRVLLSLPEGGGVHHVELDVVAVQAEVGSDQVENPWSPSLSERSLGVNFWFRRVPPVARWSIFEAERTTPVGPLVSAPWTGEIPSERGWPLLRPSGVAPVTRPK